MATQHQSNTQGSQLQQGAQQGSQASNASQNQSESSDMTKKTQTQGKKGSEMNQISLPDLGGFNQIAVGLSDAIQEFQKFQKTESYSSLMDLLGPVGEYGRNAVTSGMNYVRRNPKQIAFGAIAIGLLAVIAKPGMKATKTLH